MTQKEVPFLPWPWPHKAIKLRWNFSSYFLFLKHLWYFAKWFLNGARMWKWKAVWFLGPWWKGCKRRRSLKQPCGARPYFYGAHYAPGLQEPFDKLGHHHPLVLMQLPNKLALQPQSDLSWRFKSHPKGFFPSRGHTLLPAGTGYQDSPPNDWQAWKVQWMHWPTQSLSLTLDRHVVLGTSGWGEG